MNHFRLYLRVTVIYVFVVGSAAWIGTRKEVISAAEAESAQRREKSVASKTEKKKSIVTVVVSGSITVVYEIQSCNFDEA